MFHRSQPAWRARAGGAALLAILLVLLACEIPSPTMPELGPPLAHGAEGRNAEGELDEPLTAEGRRMQTALAMELDTLVYTFLDGGSIAFRIRTAAEDDDSAPAVCGRRDARLDDFAVWWPNCGGAKIYGDTSVTLAKVHPVMGRLLEGGPARKAGLRQGDVVLSINGRDSRRVLAPFRDRYPSRSYRVLVSRDGVEHEIEFSIDAPSE